MKDDDSTPPRKNSLEFGFTVLEEIAQMADRQGVKPDVLLAVVRLVWQSGWYENGRIEYCRVNRKPISNKELARIMRVSIARAKRIRLDPFFQQFIDIEEGSSNHVMPKYTVNSNRVYSRLQEERRLRKEGLQQQPEPEAATTEPLERPGGDRLKRLPQSRLPGEAATTEPLSGSHVATSGSHVATKRLSQSPFLDSRINLRNNNTGTSSANASSEAALCEHGEVVVVGEGSSFTGRMLHSSSDQRLSATLNGNAEHKLVPPGGPPQAEFQSAEDFSKHMQLEDIPKALNELHEYILTVPISTKHIKDRVLIAHLGRREPLTRIIVELCRRRGERSPAAVGKIIERLQDIYADHGYDLEATRAFVAERIKQFASEEPSREFAPGSHLLGCLNRAEGVKPTSKSKIKFAQNETGRY